MILQIYTCSPTELMSDIKLCLIQYFFKFEQVNSTAIHNRKLQFLRIVYPIIIHLQVSYAVVINEPRKDYHIF